MVDGTERGAGIKNKQPKNGGQRGGAQGPEWMWSESTEAPRRRAEAQVGQEGREASLAKAP